MNRFVFLPVFIFCSTLTSLAQILTSSNLPIVIIKTDYYADIVDDPRVTAGMKIIDRGIGLRNYVTDKDSARFLNYNGRIDIETRGSTSQFLDKKPYSFSTKQADDKTNNNVSLLGMPAENDWILNSMAFDSSMMRDYLAYTLSRQMGNYASRTVYCELIINDNYMGLYVLAEKIKADDNRVDVYKIKNTDNTVPDITGGYITKADKTTGNDAVAWQVWCNNGDDVEFIHELPKSGYVTPQQNSYIKNEFDKLGNASNHSELLYGYPSIIDVPSFVDFMLINELFANVDAYQYSTYFHKDRNGKLRAGPIWDFNLTCGNDLFMWGFDRSKTNTWQFANGDNEGAPFWTNLFNNADFKCYLSKRWHELTQPNAPLNETVVTTLIDQTVQHISEAVLRENARWGDAVSFDKQIADIKTFLHDRIAWIDANIGSFSACSNITTPPLVITKIMYNPSTSVLFPDSPSQEYIEIKNTGTEAVNMTGVYFSGTGFVYQFPTNASIAGGKSIQLAANSVIFQQKYGFAPFGQFTRHLSDKSQKIVLADGFGNIIDQVEYADTAPWPNADGNGYLLALTDVSLDNNVASSWTAAADILLTTPQNNDIQVSLYPNPVTQYLYLTTNDVLVKIEITDSQGRLMQTMQPNTNNVQLNMNNYATGIYVVTITTRTEKTIHCKVLKK